MNYILEKEKFGEASGSEVLKSRVSLSDLEQIYENSQNQVSSAKETLITCYTWIKMLILLLPEALLMGARDLRKQAGQ